MILGAFTVPSTRPLATFDFLYLVRKLQVVVLKIMGLFDYITAPNIYGYQNGTVILGSFLNYKPQTLNFKP